MIVQCKKCETKFRFDEAVINGEGVWVRCSICKNVFFQDNPRREETAAISAENTAKDTETVAIENEPIVITERRAARSKGLSPGFIEAENAGVASTAEPEESLPDEREYFLPEERGTGVGIAKVAACSLLIILVLGGICLWLFSPFSTRDMSISFGGQALTEWISSLPLVENILGAGSQQKDFSITQVKLQDLKQRVVKNMLLGDLRVVEGTAFNQSEYVISRIQVRGRIYDAAGAVLGERISSCGNILTDEELASMTEDEIQRALSLSLGRNVLNDRIAANSRIPFMIVFINVPPAEAKTTVLPVGAERLLP